MGEREKEREREREGEVCMKTCAVLIFMFLSFFCSFYLLQNGGGLYKFLKILHTRGQNNKQRLEGCLGRDEPNSLVFYSLRCCGRIKGKRFISFFRMNKESGHRSDRLNKVQQI